MSRRERDLRLKFLEESREQLLRRRSQLAGEFSRELRRCRDQCIEARVLRGENAAEFEADEAMESEPAKALIREIASHPKLGRRLRELAGEIDELDGRLARIDTSLRSLGGTQ